MNEQEFKKFIQHIGIMKPNAIKDENTMQYSKLLKLLCSKEYVAEEKIDGCHYLNIGTRFLSTDNIEKTHNFPHIRDFFSSLKMPNLIIDGEMHYPGKTSQYCTRVTGASPEVAINFQNANGPIHYTFWDILRTPKGTWLINEPYSKRRQFVEYFYNTYVKNTRIEEFMHITEMRIDNKEEYYKELIEAGREGIILKRLDSIYTMGKAPMWQWMKMKQKDTADLFISGTVAPKILYEGKQIENWPYWKEVNGILTPVTKFYYLNWIGAIELSAFVKGKLTTICTCSGIDEQLRKDISENFSKYLNKVVKISYMEKTEAGYPRHPRFEEFHESKTATECVWDLIV